MSYWTLEYETFYYTKKIYHYILFALVYFILVVYSFGHILDSWKGTFVFIKSVSDFRTVSVVGEAGGADPTL